MWIVAFYDEFYEMAFAFVVQSQFAVDQTIGLAWDVSKIDGLDVSAFPETQVVFLEIARSTVEGVCSERGGLWDES